MMIYFSDIILIFFIAIIVFTIGVQRVCIHVHHIIICIIPKVH